MFTIQLDRKFTRLRIVKKKYTIYISKITLKLNAKIQKQIETLHFSCFN